jgi:hypothetical protein
MVLRRLSLFHLNKKTLPFRMQYNQEKRTADQNSTVNDENKFWHVQRMRKEEGQETR